LNMSREGDSTTSLGSLGQCSVTLRGKKFFLMFSKTKQHRDVLQIFLGEAARRPNFLLKGKKTAVVLTSNKMTP